MENTEATVALLVSLLRTRQRIVVVVGAGISTSAGIPDFQSKKSDMYHASFRELSGERSSKDAFNYRVYQAPGRLSAFHDLIRKLAEKSRDAEPTSFHEMLASIAKDGRLLRLYTQNIDGLDTRLPPLATKVPLEREGDDWPQTIQLHGSLEFATCESCNTTVKLDPRVFGGAHMPPCQACNANNLKRAMSMKRTHSVGGLRPRIVLYDDHMQFDADAIGMVMASDAASWPDAVIVVGTSLRIDAAKHLVRTMAAAAASAEEAPDKIVAWVNSELDAPEKAIRWDIALKTTADIVAEEYFGANATPQRRSKFIKSRKRSKSMESFRPTVSPLGAYSAQRRKSIGQEIGKVVGLLDLEPDKRESIGQESHEEGGFLDLESEKELPVITSSTERDATSLQIEPFDAEPLYPPIEPQRSRKRKRSPPIRFAGLTDEESWSLFDLRR